MSPYMNELVCY